MKTLEAVLDRVRSKGERITIPRRLVIEALLASEDHHRSIHDVQAYIRQRQPEFTISDTTIYRVLQWLKELGLVSQTDIGQAGIVYGLIDQPFHHHLICLNCGRISQLEDSVFASLRQHLRDQYEFEARIEHMAIYGVCHNCARL